MLFSFVGHPALTELLAKVRHSILEAMNYLLGRVKEGQVKDSPIARLFTGLEKILPPGIHGITRTPIRLGDSEFNRVTDWCKINGFDEWGKRPRTFVVLYMIGCPAAIDNFVEEDLSDIALPYTAENLPRVVTGALRAQFLDYQQHVLTFHAHELERGGCSHQNFDGDADQAFWFEKDLGSGGFGIVDEVQGRLSLRYFARKRVPRGRTFKRDRIKVRIFENELSFLKQLSHRHLVKLVGSYTDRRYVGFLMTPVADMDLDCYLASTEIDTIDRQRCLRTFYGCLATALEYLHQQRIRHKDIKPKNVLIYNRQVLLADFGTSQNWDDNGEVTGEGRKAFTRAHCAPEVALERVGLIVDFKDVC